MKQPAPVPVQAELQPLVELTHRVGCDPLLTQASTGNSSIKLDGVLWIKASGRWMADALRDDIFIPLDWVEVVTECLRQGMDPVERYTDASLETAMHAVLLHRVVLHVHCVNTIAWAVRGDAPLHLQAKLDGLRWQWIPYVPSGLPLSREIERAQYASPDTNIFVLGNHGLVIAAEDTETVQALLAEVQARLAIRPRQARPADYAALAKICRDSGWDLPCDEGLHALATDPISQAILADGLLYPCHAIFSGSRCNHEPFLIVKGSGVVVGRTIAPAELAMLSGLAQVVQRISAYAPLRYLTQDEVTGLSNQVTGHYRELASASRAAVAAR